MTSAAELLRAFDLAISAADREARSPSATRAGAPAAERFAALRDELARARASAAERGTVDPAWIRALVRSTVEWLPDDALPLLAALGAIARAGAPRA